MKRNTLKGWIPTTGLALVLTFGATFANAGIVVGTLTDSTCTTVSEKGIAETLKDFIKEIIGADVKAPAPCERVDNGIVVGT